MLFIIGKKLFTLLLLLLHCLLQHSMLWLAPLTNVWRQLLPLPLLLLHCVLAFDAVACPIAICDAAA